MREAEPNRAPGPRCHGIDVTPRRAAIAAGAWCVVFGAVHVYWALGGRAGLGTSAADADEAFSTPWFWAYNAAVAVLSIGGAIVAAATSMGIPPRTARRLRGLSRVAGGVLLVRGGLGTVLLLVDLVAGGLESMPAPVLVAVEPGFVAGGLAFTAVGRAGRAAQ